MPSSARFAQAFLFFLGSFAVACCLGWFILPQG